MESENLTAIAERFGFEEWRGKSQDSDAATLREIAIPDGTIAGLDAARIRVIALDDGTTLHRATWQAEGGEGVNRLDLRECGSVEEAHEVLLELLANMQSPLVERLGGDLDVGDVAFAQDPSTSVVFARANVAAKVDVAPDGALRALDTARAVDEWLAGSARPIGETMA